MTATGYRDCSLSDFASVRETHIYSLQAPHQDESTEPWLEEGLKDC
jgi:hypothetical protein